PPRFHWFSPLGWPEQRPTVVATAILASLAAVRFVHPAFGKRRLLALLAAIAAAWSLSVLARETLASPGVRAYALMMFWHRDFLPLAYVIPFAVVWITLPSLLTESGQQGVPTGVGLLYFFAVTSLLLLYPA